MPPPLKKNKPEAHEPVNQLLEMIEFIYDELDTDKKMYRMNFQLYDFVDAVPKRIFMDPWIPNSYSGKDQINKIHNATVPGTVRTVDRVYILQPWRQFRNYPFFYTEEVDMKFIQPSGQ